MQIKKNVDVFNQDVLAGQGYKYTDENRLSSRISNARMTQGIKAATDWQGKSVIDIGCGDGSYTKLFTEFGVSHVLGVDPADVAISNAQKNYANITNLSFVVGNIYQLEQLQQTFDIAVIRGVLHHLPDAKSAIGQVSNIAKEIIILEPNGANPVLKIIEQLSSYHREHEEQSFLPSTLQRWCHDAGLTIHSQKFINFVPFFCPVWLARILKFFEPLVESLPIIRIIACGQIIIKANHA